MCRVFYIGSNSVTGWDCTYSLLTCLSSQITWAPTLYIPLLHQHQYAERRTGGRLRRRRRKGESVWPTLFFSQLSCFKPSHVTVSWRLPPERKVCVKGMWGSQRNVQQQLRPRLSPALTHPPLHTVLHTRVYIFIVRTKPSLYQGPSTFRCWEQNKKIRNVH